MFQGIVFLVQDPWSGEWTPYSLGRISAIVIIILFIGCLPEGVVLDYIMPLALLPVLL